MQSGDVEMETGVVEMETGDVETRVGVFEMRVGGVLARGADEETREFAVSARLVARATRVGSLNGGSGGLF